MKPVFAPSKFSPLSLSPKVVFEDAHVVVFEKPAGLLSQPGSGPEANLPNLVKWLRDRYPGCPPYLIHRLDRLTSGLMVAGRNARAAEKITDQLQSGKLNRQYLAVVYGTVPLSPSPLKLEHWLKKNPKNNHVTVFTRETPEAKQAVLRAEVIKHFNSEGSEMSLLQITLETGRSHQIRAQLAKAGFPLVGDDQYAGAKRPGVRTPSSFLRPALHSFRLSFSHPMTGAPLQFEASMPEDLLSLTEQTESTRP